MDAQKQARREMLETLEREPYFARLDFQEDGMEQPVSYYIGKRGLDKHDTNELPSMQSCFLLFQVSALRGSSAAATVFVFFYLQCRNANFMIISLISSYR